MQSAKRTKVSRYQLSRHATNDRKLLGCQICTILKRQILAKEKLYGHVYLLHAALLRCMHMHLIVATVWFTISLTLCSSFTQYIMSGGQTYGFITELFFDVFSSKELHCFYEDFLLYSDISISTRVVDTESQLLHMRIRSPSKNISKWYEGIDQAEFSGMLREGGTYEICTKVDVTGTRHVRLMLVIYAHHRGTKNKANKLKKEHHETTEKMNESISNLREMIASSAFALKQLKSTRDIHLQIKNANNIDMFSLIQTIIILCTAIVQVLA
uniref:Bm13375, isoform b n=1 Tax=Brugia malayi TaxID=6279 RepID=A0A0J9YAP6_BRUMA|nr:Bm13375, isoform b [Brugia malayi]